MGSCQKHLLGIALDLVVIVVIALTFILEDQEIELPFLTAFAGISVVAYGLWMTIKRKPKKMTPIDFLVTLVVYGILGPLLHLIKSIYKLIVCYARSK